MKGRFLEVLNPELDRNPLMREVGLSTQTSITSCGHMRSCQQLSACLQKAATVAEYCQHSSVSLAAHRGHQVQVLHVYTRDSIRPAGLVRRILCEAAGLVK